MAKRIEFSHTTDFQDLVIGIATDVRSWKLCYELNQILGLQLRNTDHPHPKEPIPDQDPEYSLLPPDSAGPFVEEFYEDHDSFPSREVVLYSKDPQNIPAEARPFRFFLLIRSEIGQQTLPGALLSALGQSPLITSAVDLSSIKQLQHLLP